MLFRSYGDIYALNCDRLSVSNTQSRASQNTFVYSDGSYQTIVSNNNVTQSYKNSIYFVNGSRNSIVNNNIVNFDSQNANLYSGIVLDGDEQLWLVSDNIVIGDQATPVNYGLYGLVVNTVETGTLGQNYFSGKIGRAHV